MIATVATNLVASIMIKITTSRISDGQWKKRSEMKK